MSIVLRALHIKQLYIAIMEKYTQQQLEGLMVVVVTKEDYL